jgi:hypothetical protein
VSHPSLGLPPLDHRAGHPAAATSIRTGRVRVAARALELAVDRDPTFRDRYSELAMRELLADTEVLAERLALAVASADPTVMGQFAEQLAPRYRKRGVPLDDMIGIVEGLRSAAATAVVPEAVQYIDAGVASAVAAFKWHRRLAGDARKRNAFIEFIYKGA